MFFVGWSCTVLFLPLISDRIGRKWIFSFSMIGVAACMAGLLFSRNINLTIFLMFMEGALTSGRTMVGYVFINEFFTPDWQVVFGTLFNFVDGSTYLFMTFYFDFINKHYWYFSFIGLFFTVIGTIGAFYYLVESPLWALKAGQK